MKRLLLLISVIFLGFTNSYATHLMGAEITYTHVSGNDYEVTLIIYRDCSGAGLSTNSANVTFESATCGLNFNMPLPYVATNDVSQVCPGQTTTCNGGTVPGTEQFIYRDIVSLPPCSDWIMHWNSGNRNPAITNLVNPNGANIYVQNTLNNIIGTNNNSPQYFNLPTPYLCANNLAIYSHAASDPDGDSLYYSLNNPLTTPGPPGTNIAFTGGYSLAQPMITAAGMNLNQQTGEMCFTPTQAQVSVVSILIEEYRNGVLIGSQIREMQVVVTGCTNQNPTSGVTATCGGAGGLTNIVGGPSVDSLDQNSVRMCPNDNVCFDVIFSDPDGDNIDVATNIAVSIPTATFTIVNNNTPNPIATFCWTPTALDSGLNVFAVILTDDACPISGTQTFTYDITVFDEPYAGEDDTICGPQSAQLNATGGATYTWFYDGTTTQVPVGPEFSCNPCFNPLATPLVTTSYYVVSSLTAACENTDTVTVNVVADFTPDALGDTTLCDYLNRPLDVVITAGAPGAYTYLWNNAATLNNVNTQTPVASPTESTWYTVEVTSPLGCRKSDSALVQVVPPPNVQINPGDSTICAGDVLNFSVESSCLYTLSMYDSWGDGWNGQSLDIFENGVLIGNYTVTNTTNNGDSNIVTFPVINGNTIDVIYNTGAFQNESSFNIVDGTGATVVNFATGSMTGLNTGNVLYTGAANCGPSLTAYTYNWSPVTDLSNPTINDPILTANTITGLTTYTVTLSDAVSGCSIDRTQDISVIPGYTLTSTQNDTDICVGDVVNFGTTAAPAGAYSYNWTSNIGTIATATAANTTITYNTTGTDTVYLEVDNTGAGCIRRDTFYVNVADIPNINITTLDT
ncbi:MAG: hypothetical protein P8Q14_09530, partial [Vicingaceae bacterium]|nr:hypothetical protein [Vicingaceae bacterium]